MECRRAEELFSDHLEAELHPLLAGELERHLAGCEGCRLVRAALAEVVLALRESGDPAVPEGLAERSARAALLARRPLEIRPAFVLPPWLHAAAAGLALIALGAALAVVGPERGTRAAQKIVGETVSAGSSLIERKDRLIEDVRLLGVVLGAAFEGRIERVNDRVNDYRKLIERRKAARPAEPRQGRERRGMPVQVAEAFRTTAAAGS